MKSRETIERIYITKEDFTKVENEIRFQEHLRRYASVRRFVFGSVLDFACGCGYGSSILAVNPEVSEITALDIDGEAIDWAKANFAHPKVKFVQGDIASLSGPFDTLVCLETIEHIEDLNVLKNLVTRSNFGIMILSFPDKKSTHFNSFHFHDFVVQDILDLFPDYILFHAYKLVDVQFMLLTKKPEKAPPHIFRNLQDLR